MAAQSNHPVVIIGMQCMNAYRKVEFSDWTKAQQKGFMWCNIKYKSHQKGICIWMLMDWFKLLTCLLNLRLY